MISREERRYLVWVGRSAWTGAGAIAEVGPWLGGSTYCLATGMRSSRRDGVGRLHVYDEFVWRPFMADRAPLPLQPGDSFRSLFERNLSPFSELIRVHECRLPDDHEALRDQNASAGSLEEGGPRSGAQKRRTVPELDGSNLTVPSEVEVLFVDGAKSWRGFVALLRAFAPALLPGKSLLVLQDYKYWGAYWIPAVTSRLAAALEPIHNVLQGGTVAFRVTSPLHEPLSDLEPEVAAVPVDRGVHDIEAGAGILQSDGDRFGAAAVRLAKVRFLSHKGRSDDAVDAFRAAEASWPVGRDTGQLRRAAAYLLAVSGAPIARTVRGTLLGISARFGHLADAIVRR